jgi:anti-sigma factor RsiW
MLGPYVDGELDASKLIEVDQHVSVCEVCRENVHLLRAMRGSLKQVIHTVAPEGLSDRVGNAMAAERARMGLASTAPGKRGGERSAPWQSLVPLATAAAVALAWAMTKGQSTPRPDTEVRAGLGDDLLAELVADHSQPLPPDETNAQAVRGLVERYVHVPVRPGSFERAGAHLIGVRVVPIRSERAAMLQYVIGAGDDARRVSVYVFDARKVPLGLANLAPREVGTAEVRVGREKGYSVAATQRAGVGYLLASDLDPDQNARLAAAVYDDR